MWRRHVAPGIRVEVPTGAAAAALEEFLERLEDCGGIMPIGAHELDNWFTHHPPVGDQADRYIAIREAGKAFALAILAHTPASADQTSAIRKIREAVMTANSAIACGGR